MKRQTKNLPASIAARLRNIAREAGVDYNSILLLYMQERFLYRLSISAYAGNFLLKGGLLFFCMDKFLTRPTKDMDFLAHHLNNQEDKIKEVISAIAHIRCADGIIFRTDDLSVETILEHGHYEGVRVGITCFLGKAQNRLQIDIGFGDVVVPKPVNLDFPVLLATDEVPVIRAYSLESTIAEKFDAMIRLSVINSRMKDFYDIYILSRNKNFDGRILQEAIIQTFTRRRTPLERRHPIFEDEFIQSLEKQSQWDAFRRNIRENTPESFAEVMTKIVLFLLPVFEAVCSEDEFFLCWKAKDNCWC